jgi:hypothetical protein
MRRVVIVAGPHDVHEFLERVAALRLPSNYLGSGCGEKYSLHPETLRNIFHRQGKRLD